MSFFKSVVNFLKPAPPLRPEVARAPLVAWQGVLRIAAGTIFLGYIVYGGIGADLLLAAVLDIVIGAIYLLGLPRALGTTLAAVLCDRIVIPRES